MENICELLRGFPRIFILIEGETQGKKTKQLEHNLKEKTALKMQSLLCGYFYQTLNSIALGISAENFEIKESNPHLVFTSQDWIDPACPQ